MAEIILENIEATSRFAKAFGQLLQPDDVVCLQGDLGSGKTAFTRAAAIGMGIDSRLVASPSFAIMHQYSGKIPLYHFDFYRLGSGGEIIELGFDELFYAAGVCIIEWPEIADGFLPENRLIIEFTALDENRRQLALSSANQAWEERIKQFISTYR
ncbi:MAG: tRNA (adenosine(37)-N6)-threonylcarbamoyltransferase complex ATPase subunit type 1 TsaE [Deltaproteobacteria bacterium]|nr:MAG: tRNA (adenosine(37)-N6)-threonylcarbamoyltransferase complex ATPase subunit type 1 TsaE [Deltaproteobacteria bacterium]